MQIVILYVSTAIVFFGVDFLGLKFLVKPTFEQHIGPLLADSIRIGPAAVFYLFYVGGLLWFVSLPALREGSLMQAALGGALLGALAYGTYEFTSYAVMRDWHWQMVATDFLWGTFLTGLAAVAGVAITRAVT